MDEAMEDEQYELTQPANWLQEQDEILEGQVCTGCEQHLYTDDADPCPICFPGLERNA